MRNSISHLIRATGYAWHGFKIAIREELPFQLEMSATVILIPLAIWIGHSGLSRALLILSWLIVPIIELINSAIEAAIDRIGSEHHVLSKKAKDLAAAAVGLALLNAILVWIFIVWSRA